MAHNSPVERAACVVEVPTQWLDAIAGSAVTTGGMTTGPRAVGPAGEVVAVRDSGEARDLLLIGTDRSVRVLYAVPEPNVFVIGGVGIDDRWIAFSVDHLPRNANGVLPQVKRIEVIDRQTGALRTVAEQSDADTAAVPERNVIDSVTLSDGKVYWIARDGYNGTSGVARSFDPLTGVRADVASGLISDIQAGPAGVAWSKTPAKLPPEITGIPAPDLASIGTDGTAFGWISGVTDGGDGIGYWSPQTGVVKVTGVDVDVKSFVPRVVVFDSFVILDAGGSTATRGSSATIVDTRSGAAAALTPRTPGQYDRVVASRGGTLALDVWAGPGREPKQPESAVGLLRTGSLNPLQC